MSGKVPPLNFEKSGTGKQLGGILLNKNKEDNLLSSQTNSKSALGGGMKKKKTKDFYQTIEAKDTDANLFELISIEIHKIFSQEMERYKGVTAEYNSMLKRKNLLEAKLFKRKYEKMQKHLNGMPSMDRTLNPFSRPYVPSVFNEVNLYSNN